MIISPILFLTGGGQRRPKEAGGEFRGGINILQETVKKVTTINKVLGTVILTHPTQYNNTKMDL